MKNEVLFIYNPWKYFHSYKNVLLNVRMNYPDADVIIFFDPSREDLDKYIKVAEFFKCKVTVREKELGYIKKEDALEINAPKQAEWIDRLKTACEMSEAEWVLLLEDDVIIKRQVEQWPTADCGKNLDQIGFLGGGSVFKREKFLDSLEKADIFAIMKKDFTSSWAGDHLLRHIFRDNRATEEKWVELLEAWQDEGQPHAVYHGYKLLHHLG
jgi:hypothetical protein